MHLRQRIQSGEGRRLTHPPGVVGDPLERDLAVLPHLGEQPDHRPLVFDLVLLDHAADRQGIEDLPDSLRIIRGQDVDDRRGMRDLRLSTSEPFYVASYIKPVWPVALLSFVDRLRRLAVQIAKSGRLPSGPRDRSAADPGPAPLVNDIDHAASTGRLSRSAILDLSQASTSAAIQAFRDWLSLTGRGNFPAFHNLQSWALLYGTPRSRRSPYPNS